MKFWSEIRNAARLVWQFADRRMKPEMGPFPDRLFLYFGGELDTDNEAIEVSYFREGTSSERMKVTIESQLFTREDHRDRLIDAWMNNKRIPVALQFGGSGKILKTEVLVSDLKIVGSSESSRIICSLVSNVAPFQ